MKSTESEYRDMSSACSEVTWLRGLLGELGVPQFSPTVLHADNTSAIQLATNPVFHERSKHIEVDCHSIREVVAQNVITLLHISTDIQIADVFKSLDATTTSVYDRQIDAFRSTCINLRGVLRNVYIYIGLCIYIYIL
jgi:hypothetical protein